MWLLCLWIYKLNGRRVALQCIGTQNKYRNIKRREYHCRVPDTEWNLKLFFVWLFGVFVCPDTLNFECSTSSNKGSNWFIFPTYLAIHSALGVCNMILHPFEQFQPMRLKLSNSNNFIIFLFPLFYFLVSFMLFRWRTSVTCKKFLHFIWKKVREMQTPF